MGKTYIDFSDCLGASCLWVVRFQKKVVLLRAEALKKAFSFKKNLALGWESFCICRAANIFTSKMLVQSILTNAIHTRHKTKNSL